jgi:hypothetical protein
MRQWPCLILLLLSCGGDTLSSAAATIKVQPLALDFGPVPVGLPVSLELEVRNLGRQQLVLQPMKPSLPDYAGSTSVLQLAAGERQAVEITFTPSLAGERTGVVRLPSNAGNDPELVIAVTGQGTPRLVCSDCNSPPPSYCASKRVLIAYEPHGTCVTNKCEYQATSIVCGGSCVPASAQCTDATDAGRDAGADAGSPGLDAGVDAGRDAGTDAGSPGVDAGVDAGRDAGTGPRIFDVADSHLFVVPPGVTSVVVQAWGGGGAGGGQVGATGGGGAYVRGTFAVTPGETLTVWVGEGGIAPGSGAGASALLRATTALVVAAGGGGGGSDGCSGCVTGGRGGAGGTLVGQDGQNIQTQISPYCTSATGGRGGSAAAGGAGGTVTGSAANKCPGQPGFATGGGRATGVNGNCDFGPGASTWHQGGGQGNGGGGAGGAGVYGGGAGGFIWTYCAGGGGGGASFVSPGATQVTDQSGNNQQQGNVLESAGAGAGGAVSKDGRAGRVVITH